MNTKIKKITLPILGLFAFLWIFSYQVALAETCSEKNGICRVYYSGSDVCESDEQADSTLTGCPSGENCCVSTTSPPTPTTTTGGAFDYVPMEKIPGFSVSGSFPDYILTVYKFGIWSVGIAALLMIMVGGFMYITSAGNNASMEKAKGIIFDSVVGILLVLTAYLILYVINPELVKIKLISGTINTGGGGSVGIGSTAQLGTGSCSTITAAGNPCTVENLQSAFGSQAETASAICNRESAGGNPNIGSGSDRCQGNGVDNFCANPANSQYCTGNSPKKPSVSWGLFQINLTNHTVGGFPCGNAFSSQYTASNHNCSITNETLYKQCVDAAKNPQNNLAAAVAEQKSGGWGRWGACYDCNICKK